MNRGPNRGGSAAIRYPVRTWLGKYESYLLTMYGSRSFYTADYLLEKFLTHFPNVRSLDEFSVVDISEYFRWRLECGRNPHTLGQELQAVDRWYCWLIEDKGLPLLNPAKGFRSASEQRTKNENRLTLSEYRRLLDVCEAPARDYLVGLAFGQERKTGWDPGQMGRYLCARFRELGLPYTTIQAFRRAIRRSLWREIIRIHYKQVYDTLLEKPEPPSSALAEVQVPAADIRPTISDNDFEDVMWMCGVH
jgi:integrase